MTCPMFQDDCRFCSHEHMIVPYAPLIEDPRSKRLIAGPVEHRKEPVGFWCNNVSEWVEHLRYCPARWGLHSVTSSGQRAGGCGVYPDAYGQSLIPREDVFLIVGTGQQTLGGVIEI
jgi:hypothetical protein